MPQSHPQDHTGATDVTPQFLMMVVGAVGVFGLIIASAFQSMAITVIALLILALDATALLVWLSRIRKSR